MQGGCDGREVSCKAEVVEVKNEECEEDGGGLEDSCRMEVMEIARSFS